MTPTRSTTLRALSMACVLAAAVLLGGCGSNSAQSLFYRMGSLTPGPPQGDITSRLLVGPVGVPDYLDRPQLVSRAGTYQLSVDEFHRWAGSLREEVLLTMIDNLSALLEDVLVGAYGEGTAVADALQLRIEIQRLEGTVDGRALLDARWSLLGDDGRVQHVGRRSRMSVAVAGDSPSALVAAYSEAMETLSREVADAIRGHLH